MLAAEEAQPFTTEPAPRQPPNPSWRPRPERSKPRPRKLWPHLRRKRRPSRNSSRCGGPPAGRKTAGRGTTATVSAISSRRHRTARRRTPAGGAGEGDKRDRNRQGRRNDRFKDFRKPRESAPGEVAAAAPVPAEGAPAGERRNERFEGKGFEGKGRDRDNERRRDNKFGGGERKGDRDRDRGGRDRDKGGGRDKGGRDKRENGPSLRPYASSASPRERDRPVDPNSPFAKLAALKEQLAANRKD